MLCCWRMIRLLVFVLPGPDPGHERLPADVVAGLAFELVKPLLDDRLGRDPGVVRSRHPQGVGPHHPVPADEQVLHDVVHGMAHVEGAGDVGQGHHDDVTLGPEVRHGGERVFLEPALGDRPFVELVVVELRQFFRHRFYLPGRGGEDRFGPHFKPYLYHIGIRQANRRPPDRRD